MISFRFYFTAASAILWAGVLPAQGFPPGTWTQLSPASSPSARSGHAMAYDNASAQVVLFGGSDQYGTLGDTWVWDGSNWTQKYPVNSPSTRSVHAMAYDTANAQVVLFGGIDPHGNAL